MKYLIAIMLVVAGMKISAASLKASDKEFSFYLLKTPGIPVTSRIDKIVLADAPLFTIDDVISYSKNAHVIKLTSGAFKKFQKLAVGTQFAICVGRKPLYAGIVRSEIMSSTYNGIIAIVPDGKEPENIVEIRAGYPDSKYFKGTDPRSSQLILDSIKKSGKLTE